LACLFTAKRVNRDRRFDPTACPAERGGGSLDFVIAFGQPRVIIGGGGALQLLAKSAGRPPLFLGPPFGINPAARRGWIARAQTDSALFGLSKDNMRNRLRADVARLAIAYAIARDKRCVRFRHASQLAITEPQMRQSLVVNLGDEMAIIAVTVEQIAARLPPDSFAVKRFVQTDARRRFTWVLLQRAACRAKKHRI